MKKPITITLDEEVIALVEKKAGLATVSAYINDVLRKYLKLE